jgi:hypothetical protein
MIELWLLITAFLIRSTNEEGMSAVEDTNFTENEIVACSGIDYRFLR